MKSTLKGPLRSGALGAHLCINAPLSQVIIKRHNLFQAITAQEISF